MIKVMFIVLYLPHTCEHCINYLSSIGYIIIYRARMFDVQMVVVEEGVGTSIQKAV